MNRNKSNIDSEKIINHWIEMSDDDFKTMLVLYDSKSYSWSLFLGHISIEKLLKALYVKQFQEHAPFTHNLFRLGELTGLKMTNELADWLDEITSFNLNARYDSFRREFYKLCTPEYTSGWIEKIIIIREWIKEMF